MGQENKQTEDEHRNGVLKRCSANDSSGESGKKMQCPILRLGPPHQYNSTFVQESWEEKKSVGIRVAFTWWSKKKRAKRDSKVLVRKCSVLTNRHEKKKCPSRKKIMLWKGCVVVIFFSRLHRWNEINISLLASFYQLTKRTFFRMLVAAQQFKYNQPRENVWRTRPIIYRILDIFHGKSRRNIKF